ncbi:MAG TPA: DNA-formamidopyrimidine glycosylase family protein [Pyrinomonadaceae bacterium]|nr:DNA-formamidopyrimidine glycosylase family protein [Pyrinomonadaceae bacterium]
MPEFPDIVVYLEALDQRVLGETLKRITLGSPFLLRTAEPPLASVQGQNVVALRRLGKRICFGFANDLWLVLHLMIAGRLHWKDDTRSTIKKGGAAKLPNKRNLATFEFTNGALSLTEAGTQRRASLHLVAGEAALASLDPGGLEVFQSDLSQFASVLQSANHTLKRALTDPRLFSGIGNAYSDEILWHAKLSPIALTQKLQTEEIERLFNSTRALLTEWVELLRAEAHGKFPEKVTAFRPEMAVHGKYQEPCPRCGSKVRRIRYAANETNYCPSCQTGGKLLADRALSRLLRADWPRSEEELERVLS